MLNWYRAALPHLLPRSPAGICIDVPALLLWGARDAFLGRELVQPTIDLCSSGRAMFLENASHWLTHEEPKRVNESLSEFLNAKA
jgi:pimeloyl-ACP methyl ester carboxylesterase